MTLEKFKELKDIVMNFNECLETISAGLEQLERRVKAIVDNIITKIAKLSIGTDSIIRDMKKDLEHGKTVLAEMPKSISSLKSLSSTLSTISTINPVMHKLCQLL